MVVKGHHVMFFYRCSDHLVIHLQFIYHTSSHDRFLEGDFSEPSKSKRNQHPHRRELVSILISGPVAGSKSVQMQFHNLPIDIPPPPGTKAHVSDHTLIVIE